MLLQDVAVRLKRGDYKDVAIKDLIEVLRDGFYVMADMLVAEGEGATVQVPRFGRFVVKKYLGHVARNPKDGSMIRVPNRFKLRFIMSPVLNKRLNPPGISKSRRIRG